MARRVDGQLTEAVSRLADRSRSRARRRIIRTLDRTEPVRDGDLHRSRFDEEITTRTGPGVRVGYTAAHARYLVDGTRPHEIRPRRKKALAFNVRGRRVVTSRVRHPGTKPNRWWDDAIESWPDEVDRALKELA